MFREAPTSQAARRLLALGKVLAALTIAAAALPGLDGWWAGRDRAGRLARIPPARAATCAAVDLPVHSAGLASWQSLGGCGAGASASAGTGVRWIGRGVTGGLFTVQCQTSYARMFTGIGTPEHHSVTSVLVSRALSERWLTGVSVPLVWKYMRNPLETGADLSNSGLGDVSLLVTRKLGPIGATALTATIGFPSGAYDTAYRRRILNQTQQRGFGKPTAALALDHTLDETWGVMVLGGMAAWRGGENRINNYRAPAASLWGHVGYFLGPLVPAFGLTLTGVAGHDRDQTVEQYSPVALATASVSLEWSNDWIAVLVGATVPYQYDAIYSDTEGDPRSPFGRGAWTLGAGVTLSPF